MKQPYWKKLASYFHEFHIETTKSEHSRELYLLFKNGRYQLCSFNAVYSYEDKYSNFVGVFQQIDLAKIKPENVLILGLGMGSIPYILEQSYPSDYKFTAVEIDNAVISLAKKYTLPKIHSPLKIICDDALNFVNHCNEKYDMILVDLFIDDLVPNQFEQIDFLLKTKNLLTENGILISNRLGYTEKDKKETISFYKNSFLPVYPDGITILVKGNHMLLNDKKFMI